IQRLVRAGRHATRSCGPSKTCSSATRLPTEDLRAADDQRAGPRRPVREAYGVESAITWKTAPRLSVHTAKRPGEMSIGGTTVEPPSWATLATVASASSTAKYTPQPGGMSAGAVCGFGVIPPL